MLRVLDLPDCGKLIVETEEEAGKLSSEVVHEIAQMQESREPDRRTGATPVSRGRPIERASGVLLGQVKALAELARTAMAEGGSAEITIETHMKFSGGADPIPFIARASGEGGLKLTMKWKEHQQ